MAIRPPYLTVEPRPFPEPGRAVAFKMSFIGRIQLEELSALYAEVCGESQPLTITQTIRACVDFAYRFRGQIWDEYQKHRTHLTETQPCKTQRDPETGQLLPDTSSPEQQSPRSGSGKGEGVASEPASS